MILGSELSNFSSHKQTAFDKNLPKFVAPELEMSC